MLNKIKSSIDFLLKWVLVVIMAVMTINVLWQVFSRFVLQNPSSFTEEFARYMLIWVGILGASYVAGQKMHLAIDLLPSKLTGKPKAYLEIFIELCIFIFVIIPASVYVSDLHKLYKAAPCDGRSYNLCISF